MDAARLASQVTGFLDENDDLAGKSKELVLGLLAHTPAPFTRTQFTPGHITGTAAVLHPAAEAVLVVHHRRLNRWLLPGGHVEEGDAEIYDTARREAIEETGVRIADIAKPVLVGIDVHGIPGARGEPYHLHHDIVIGFRAASDIIAPSEETREVAWVQRGDWDRYALPQPARRSFLRALSQLR
jgi:8-oxo-dGTP pyrophosphatase MutT (NUDIX family)